MGTYLSKLRIFNTTTNTTSADVAFGNTLYGICGTFTDIQNKTVVLSAFDTVENGIYAMANKFPNILNSVSSFFHIALKFLVYRQEKPIKTTSI